MRKPIPKKMRFLVFQRDNHTCQYCGAKAPRVELQLDHVVPVSAGGENTFENLKTSCWDCNIGKGVISLDDREATEALLHKIMDGETCILCSKQGQSKPVLIGDYLLSFSKTRVPGFSVTFCYECLSNRISAAHQILADRAYQSFLQEEQ